MKAAEQNGFWTTGMNSQDDPSKILQTSYVEMLNGVNRGGELGTRPGFAELCEPPTGSTVFTQNTPQGMTHFKTKSGRLYKVVAFGGLIYKSPFPFKTFTQLTGLKFSASRQIVFATTVRTAQTLNDNTLQFFDPPYPVLIIADGITRTGFWDGSVARHCDPTPINVAWETPVGSVLQWCGNRLWVGDGNQLRASNLGDPLKFTDSGVTANGRYFTLPDNITCMGQTPDLKTLLVMTDQSTTTFLASILERSTWKDTPGFQNVLFPTIGCVGPKAFINKYGLSIWMAHDGLIGLDNALQTYRTASIVFRDKAMARSKVKLADNLRSVCLGEFENFLLVTVPKSSRWNSETWVMDESVITTEASSLGTDYVTNTHAWASRWTGIRPVEWVTTVIRGKKRCFCLSRDFVPNGKRYQYRLGIWETFQRQRADSLLDGTAKRITCAVEFRTMAFGPEPKRMRSYAFDATISGTVNTRLYYAGRRSTFKPCGTKKMIASRGNINTSLLPIVTPGTMLISALRQSRLVRSLEIVESKGSPMQSQFNRDIDQGFSPYVEWDGDMSIQAIRMYVDAVDDPTTGAVEKDEETERFLDQNGDEVITDDPPKDLVRFKSNSSFVSSFPPRYKEQEYSSR